MNSKLEVFIVNSGIGEYIILKIANDQFGIIDFYDNTALYYTNRLIPRDASIEFLALTHPHLDHFQGLSRFIEHNHNRIKSFWRYPGVNHKEILARYLTKPMSQHKNKNNTLIKTARTEFSKLIKTVDKYKANWGNNYHTIALPKLSSYYTSESFEIYGVAPPQAVVDEFHNFLKDPQLPFQEQAPTGENMVSYFLMVRFYSKYLFFLADIVVKSAWDNIIDCLDTAGITWNDVIFIKCSHHGSHTGWHEAFLNKAKPLKHATITNFSRYCLPRQELVKRYHTVTSSLTVVSGEYQQRHDRAKSYDQLTDPQANCDHIVVDQKGNLTSQQVRI